MQNPPARDNVRINVTHDNLLTENANSIDHLGMTGKRWREIPASEVLWILRALLGTAPGGW
jgi:hypothetical protein